MTEDEGQLAFLTVRVVRKSATGGKRTLGRMRYSPKAAPTKPIVARAVIHRIGPAMKVHAIQNRTELSERRGGQRRPFAFRLQ